MLYVYMYNVCLLTVYLLVFSYIFVLYMLVNVF